MITIVQMRQKATVITKMISIKFDVMTTLINDYNVNYKVDYLIDITQTGWKKDRLEISTTVFLTQTTAEKIGNGWDSVILIFPSRCLFEMHYFILKSRDGFFHRKKIAAIEIERNTF